MTHYLFTLVLSGTGCIAMTIVVILLLRLNWERILGRIAPWTLDDNDSDVQN